MDALARAIQGDGTVKKPLPYQSYAIYNSTGVMSDAFSLEETHPNHLFCVHDPAWWWAEASNLWRSGDRVVRFNLAHVEGG
jgi:hypothetical protein